MSCLDSVTPVVNPSRAARAFSVFSVAQSLAVQLGKENRFVNAGMVQERLSRLGFTSAELGNAAGSLFSKKLFRSTGTKVANTNPTANRRKVTVWEYIGSGLTAGPVLVPATTQNTKPGVTIEIRPELREKLTGNGKRPYTGKVIEVNSQFTLARWLVRVKFTDGRRGLLAYQEFQVLQ